MNRCVYGASSKTIEDKYILKCEELGEKIAKSGHGLVFGGGAVYGIGMVFYIVGKKKKYFHSIFHLFVLAGTIFHFFAIVTAL